MENKGKLTGIPVNYRKFILSYSSNPEDHGWKREDVEYLLNCIKNDCLDPSEFSSSESDLFNSIGTFFEEGICVNPDINAAVYWYEKAIELDNDLARSNLADILRKGSQGYTKDLKRALNFIRLAACHMPTTAAVSFMKKVGALKKILTKRKHIICSPTKKVILWPRKRELSGIL